MLDKGINRFNATPLEILMTFFHRNKMNPKMHMQLLKTLNSQSNPEEKRTELEALYFLISNFISKL